MTETKGQARLLQGENPQIAKGHGPAPVAAYIAAVPGWKQEIVRAVDRMVTETVPGVQKAVKWNSPLYGCAPGEWFLSLHCFKAYVKLGFLRGAALVPPPPDASKQPEVRYLNLREGGLDRPEDRAQLADWLRQASALPGLRMYRRPGHGRPRGGRAGLPRWPRGV